MKLFQLPPQRRYTGPVIALVEQRRASGSMLLAAFIAVGIHAFWLANAMRNIPIEPEAGKRMLTTPRVAFMDKPLIETGKPWLADVRMIGSPVIFSLPTPVGFSKPLFKGPEVKELPRKSTAMVGTLFEPDAPFRSAVYGETRQRMDAMVAAYQSVSLPQTSIERIAFRAQIDAVGGKLLAYWRESPEEIMDKTSWLAESDWAGSTTWETTVSICVDPDGIVSQAMIEKPLPSRDVAFALVRWCRQMSDLPVPRNDCGRLVFMYKPVARTVGLP